jgi:hypothetical protein
LVFNDKINARKIKFTNMLMHISALLWVGLFAAVLIYLYKFGLSHLYDYRVVKRGVEFILLRYFPVFLIKFGSIESAREISFYSVADSRFSTIFRSIVIGNRISAGLIVLKMKAGLFRYVAITPADRKAFLHDVVAHLSARKEVTSAMRR